MTREPIAAKARRYLAEGRLQVRHVDEPGGHVRADIRGNGAVHEVAFSRRTGWTCTCPARGTCCHVTAVGLVVAIEQKGGGARPGAYASKASQVEHHLGDVPDGPGSSSGAILPAIGPVALPAHPPGPRAPLEGRVIVPRPESHVDMILRGHRPVARR